MEQNKTLKKQFEEVFDNAVDENVDAGGDFKMDGYNQARTTCAEQSAKVAQRYALEQQIHENESILEMLEVHGNERCVLVVKHRIFQLEKQLNETE
jgi:hypothetical protein